VRPDHAGQVGLGQVGVQFDAVGRLGAALGGQQLVEEPGVPREGALDRPVGQRRQGLLVKLREQPGATEERDGHLGAHRPPPQRSVAEAAV
jgi:hypothetical protein